MTPVRIVATSPGPATVDWPFSTFRRHLQGPTVASDVTVDDDVHQNTIDVSV